MANWITWDNKLTSFSGVGSNPDKINIFMVNTIARKDINDKYIKSFIVDSEDRKMGKISRLKLIHGEKLPFLKKNQYKKKWNARGFRSRAIRQMEVGGYWNWKDNLFYNLSDPQHPLKIWKQEKYEMPGNLAAGSFFYSKEKKMRLFGIYKRKKRRFYKASSHLKHSNNLMLFNDSNWHESWADRKKILLGVIAKALERKKGSVEFKKKRTLKNDKIKFLTGAENAGFWGIQWWKKPGVSSIVKWDWESWSNKEVKYGYYRSKNFAVTKNENSWFNRLLKRSAAKLMLFFYKKSFAAILFKYFSLSKNGFRGTAALRKNYLKLMSIYYVFLNGLKGFVTHSATRPAAYLLTNGAFSSVMEDKFNLEVNKLLISFKFHDAVYKVHKKSVASSFGVDNTRADSSAYFSNYYKINLYIIIRYLMFIFSNKNEVFNGAASRLNKLKVNNFFRFTTLFAEKKYKKSVLFGLNCHNNKFVNTTSGKLSKKKKNLDHYKVYFAILSIFKNHFLEDMPGEYFRSLWSRPVRVGKEKLFKKSPLMTHRGPFYYKRKKTPKWFKSNKKIRLFKKFVRHYNPNKKHLSYKFYTTVGTLNRYFRMEGVKKRFKKKIYVRAKFLDHYDCSKREKLKNRWRNIQKKRHKWHGYFEEFEGNLMRSCLWLGFAHKYRLARFFMENDLVFINGFVGKHFNVSRQPVRKGDIVYLRKDIHRYINAKRDLALTKKYLAKVPFYNRTLKAKLLYRSRRMVKASLLGRTKYRRRPINKFVLNSLKKKYLQDAKSEYEGGKFFEDQPKVLLHDAKYTWHSKVKRVSTLNYVNNVLNRKSGLSAEADINTDLRSNNFLIRRGSAALLAHKPSSVNNFYYGTDHKFKKMISPRTIKFFSEMRFNY